MSGICIWAIQALAVRATLSNLALRFHILEVMLGAATPVLICALGAWLYPLIQKQHVQRIVAAGSLGFAVIGGGIFQLLALRLQANVVFHPTMLAIAALISLAGSYLTVYLISQVRLRRQLPAAVAVGLTVAGAQYMALHALVFNNAPIPVDFSQTVSTRLLTAIAIGSVLIAFLVVAVLTSGMQSRLRSRRKRARTGEPEYRGLFERSTTGMYQASRDGRILQVNVASARLWGFESRDEVRGTNLRDYFFDSDEYTTLMLNLELNRRAAGHEVQFRQRNGKTVWVIHNASLVEDDLT